MEQLFRIYLNDHLAGATAGDQLGRRLSRRGGPDGDTLAAISAEITEDRALLLRIMQRLDVPASRLKVSLGWALEKAGRLKLNGRIIRPSPLSPLIELEALASGIQGKQALWQSLQELDDPRLAEFDFASLVERARSQRERLAPCHSAAAARALAGGG